MTSKGISKATVSHLIGKACVETEGTFDADVTAAALRDASLTLTGHMSVEACPNELSDTLPDPWENRSAGLRVKTVSHGEELDLKAQLVPDSYTVIDFGAPWCEPCHEAAELLMGYLKAHPDVAVRAVNLAGQTPEASYQQPVVAQHLQYVKGVPWFIVHAPNGKVLYRGMQVSKVMTSINKHRARAARKARRDQ